MKIGFIGLGRMGSAMATNLIKAGHEVTVFNRSPEKGRRFQLKRESGATTSFCRWGLRDYQSFERC
jgi:3-hydroxyisobutyrate dehydrogenase-like beta-hydroxyacid dehydrogenase